MRHSAQSRAYPRWNHVGIYIAAVACLGVLLLSPTLASSVSIDITSGWLFAGAVNDFEPAYIIYGQDFSMTGGPTLSGGFSPTDGGYRSVPSGSMASLGGTAFLNPFNTLTYGGQTYPGSDGNFSFTTPLVLANFPAGQSGQVMTAPFTFSGEAFARSTSAATGRPPGPILQTFELRGQGLATVTFQCAGNTSCWYYGGRYEFQAAAEPAAPAPAPSSSSPSAEEPSGPTTPSASSRRVPAQPLQVTGLLDLRQQLLQLKQEWGVSVEGSGDFLHHSVLGSGGPGPVANPEPASGILMATGLMGLGIGRFILRRRL